MELNDRIYYEVNTAEKFFPTLYGEVTEYQKARYLDNFEWFKKSFGEKGAYIASSSGRVEMCGNHTDHNGGKVVSCAISLDTLAMFLPTDDGVIRIKSRGYDDIVVDTNGKDCEKKGTSAALVRGVVVGLKNNGRKIGGFKACFTSNVIGGAGISSSASFEVLIAEILNFLYNEGKIDAEEKAKVSQFSENVYFGKPCGLLDQTAIAFGGLKKLDFSDESKISVTSIDNDLKDYTLILINSGGSHADLTDEYAAIPAEMKSVAKALGGKRLIDFSEEEFYSSLPNVIDKVSDRAINRAIHFYTENNRVDSLCDALEKGDYQTFLTAIKESGISSLCKLQNCFVAGKKEQPIVKALSIAEKFLNGGANRVHGGGFAGTILNVVSNDNVNKFVECIGKVYAPSAIIPLKVRSVGTIVL